MADILSIIGIVFSIYIVWNDLYFADEGGCADYVVQGYIFDLTMATWLKVDAYVRIPWILFACALLFSSKLLGPRKELLLLAWY